MVEQQTQQTVLPEVRTVAVSAALRWLALGLEDLHVCRGASLFYGLCFAAMGWLLHFVFAHAYQYTSALATGFLLLGPFLAIGLYELSRRREKRMAIELKPTLAVWRANAGAIGVFSIILTVIMLVWARASLVIFALFYTTEMPSMQGFFAQVLRAENWEFLIAYFAAGSLFAMLVFAVSVVSIPLMLDRGTDAVTAMLTSIVALGRNLPAMLLWALLIVALTALGFATLYVGLIITMPIIGHATWHAYRELVA